MNILFLTESLPTLTGSPTRQRAYTLLRYLTQTHKVTLARFSPEGEAQAGREQWAVPGVRVHTVESAPAAGGRRSAVHSLLHAHPSGAEHPQRAEMERLVRRLATETDYDLVFAQQISMADYALAAAETSSGKTRLWLDDFPVAHRLAERQARLLSGVAAWRWRGQVEKLQRYEAKLCRQFDLLLVASGEEKGALLHLMTEEEASQGGEKVIVLPPAVEPAAIPFRERQEGAATILFAGDLQWAGNRVAAAWFAGQVLPLIVAQEPDAHLALIGAHPPEEIQMLAQKGAPMAKHVTVAGNVADAEPYWQQRSVYVAPYPLPVGITGEILTAWLRGVPVVSTRAGGEGLTMRPGKTNLVADEPGAFADAVLALLRYPVMARGIAANGREWVERHYDWRTLYQELAGAMRV